MLIRSGAFCRQLKPALAFDTLTSRALSVFSCRCPRYIAPAGSFDRGVYGSRYPFQQNYLQVHSEARILKGRRTLDSRGPRPPAATESTDGSDLRLLPLAHG